MKSEFSAVRIPLVAAFALVALSAQAADMYAPSPRGSMKDMPEVGPVWTGFYLGGGGGGGATKSNLTGQDVAIPSGVVVETANVNGLGGMGGFATAQVGYDLQFAQRIVAGAFFDYDFAGLNSSYSGLATMAGYPGVVGTTIHLNLTGSWTVGGRLGYLVNPSTLVYGLGGYTEAHFSFPEGMVHPNFSGWTAGAGIETNVGGSWFLKGEYRFTGLNRGTVLAASDPLTGTSFNITDQPDVQTGRVVLSYKMNPFGSRPLEF